MRNLTISNAVIGINQLWDWGWTYVGIKITNCSTAFSMTAGGSNAQAVGSVNIIDSVIADSPVFVDTVWSNTSMPAAAGSLILENIQLSNVPVAVQDTTGIVLAGSTGSMTISGWGQGHEYTPNGRTVFQGHITPATRPSPLLAAGSANYYTKTKPQYETYPVSSFMTARSFGAAGDGVHDDTLALQLAIDSAALFGRVLFVDYGVYKVSNTLRVPPGSRIVGESYAVIMASGGPWRRINNPVPVVQIGLDGQSGSVEWSDMIVSTQGSCPGAVLIEWNLKAKSGSGMWDVHTRIGGFDGSELQVAQCPTSAPVSANCEAAYMSMHITSSASGVYLENNWFWTADHDIDNPTNTQVSIYTGRGLLIEASVVWLLVHLPFTVWI
jgi:glucan 1,3-beta-glucosidase